MIGNHETFIETIIEIEDRIDTINHLLFIEYNYETLMNEKMAWC